MNVLDLIRKGKIKRYFRPARNASQPARSCLAVAGGREAGGATRKLNAPNVVSSVCFCVGSFNGFGCVKQAGQKRREEIIN